MATVEEAGIRLLGAVLSLFWNPFFYAGIIYVVLHLRKQIQFERKLFHTRLHSLVKDTWQSVWGGWMGGAAASVALAFIGPSLRTETLILVWGIAVILALFRVRFLCLAYAGGVLGILQVIMMQIPGVDKWTDISGIGILVDWILKADVPSVLAVAAVLHLLEAWLIRVQGERLASPMFFESKRGKIVGGYQMEGFWLVPLVLIIPSAGGSMETLPWQSFLSGQLWSSGWTIAAFPVMIGFAEITMILLPKRKARRTSNFLFLYGLVLLAASLLAASWSVLIIIASILAIGLHEAIILYGHWQEAKRTPVFVHQPRGLMVMTVLPGSAAEELGIQSGELIHKVNGTRIHHKSELHQAMRINPAFCKMEVINLDGEIKFVQHPLFAGQHHQLGLILAPDEEAMYYVELQQNSLISYLRGRLKGLMTNRSGESL
jgi:hypothetical protein